jgi:hypothetical protein
MNKDKGIEPYNDKHQRHGYWEMYWANELWYKRFYHNGKEIGYEEFYWYNGKLEEKKYYI